MFGWIFDRLFGCPHRRLSRPITPVSKPGVPSSETYVVCLDCAKQFSYDWDHMRIGRAIERSSDGGVLNPDMPDPPHTKIKYALIGSAIPLGLLIGKAIVTKRRDYAERPAGPEHFILLPYGGRARFEVRQLVEQIRESGRDYIVQGDVNCSLADHPKPSSLDCWLRENFARNKDVRQATDSVVAQLVATGLFEPAEDLQCPDSGEKCKGLRLKSPPPE